MAIVNTIRKNHYQDSMKLMQISQKLSALEGVKQASAIMATEANLLMLKEAGLIEKMPESAGANDLIIAVEAKSQEIGDEAILQLETLLAPADIAGALGVALELDGRGHLVVRLDLDRSVAFVRQR